ncbi:MAG: T9SS type A sorting domain-containing protein [Sphingobacteriales bacterium]|nr:T9SS type A sorting domain-containing protein [Sphingobacteriales bacterium]
MKTNFTQRKFYIIYALLVLAIFISRKSFAQCGSAGGNGAIQSTNSIVIDGNMGDWTPYLNDPDNNTYDGNPDLDAATISNSSFDISRFVMTQGTAGLYLYFSRAAGTNNTIDYIAYIDINNNSKMDTNEPVVDMSWNGANRKCAVKIFNYIPFNAGGDAISNNGTTDGYTLPGSITSSARSTVGNAGNGSADGQTLEVLIPWNYITQTNSSGTVINSLVYSQPFKFHISSINGSPTSIPGANSVNDNFGGCFGGTIESKGSLPILLSYFNALADENNTKVKLNWVTEMELNNDYYTIERSQDGKTYTSIGMVLGSMNSSIRKTYEYKDDLKGVDVSKTIYYRVKQSDIDGKSSYTPVRTVKLSQKQNMIQINPNPFVDNITVKYMSEVSGSMDIRVMNANGQTVVAKKSTLVKGFNSTAIYNLGSLARGLYIVEVMINGEVSEKTKLVKN